MSIAERLGEHGIRPRDFAEGSQKMPCPKCSGQRRKKSDPCLSLTIDDRGAVWKCHHCNWEDGFVLYQDRFRPASKPKPQPVLIERQPEGLTAEAIAYFASREISEDALRHAGVGWSTSRRSVVFPYRKPGNTALSNAKFRRLPKDGFSQIKDGEKLYWLLDKLDLEQGRDLYIVEGEIDALSLIEAGVPNVISVPDGAPKEVRDESANGAKFSFVATCDEWIEPFERIILATDSDEPGQALAEELARRYGKDRCWRVRWPTGTKDANDYLVEFGKVSLAEWCRKPQPYPIEGVFGVADFEDEVLALFRNGRSRGTSTGLRSVDELYTVVRGQLTIVTGVPNHGKSEFIDQLMVNLAKNEGWSLGVCSFENDPPNHLSKWAEKWLTMPFWDGPSIRMTSFNLEAVLERLRDHFHFIRSDGEESPTIDWVLEKARVLVKRFGIEGLVIDPYNELEHRRPDSMTETEYVSSMLSKVKRFAQAHDVHVWFVAHPAKMRTEGGKTPVPTLYDISGSANFVNKADCGVVVHRGAEEGTTEVYVRKVRFKWVGQQGKATLGYERSTGTYRDLGRVVSA
jgi:twinkle protein